MISLLRFSSEKFSSSSAQYHRSSNTVISSSISTTVVSPLTIQHTLRLQDRHLIISSLLNFRADRFFTSHSSLIRSSAYLHISHIRPTGLLQNSEMFIL